MLRPAKRHTWPALEASQSQCRWSCLHQQMAGQATWGSQGRKATGPSGCWCHLVELPWPAKPVWALRRQPAHKGGVPDITPRLQHVCHFEAPLKADAAALE